MMTGHFVEVGELSYLYKCPISHSKNELNYHRKFRLSELGLSHFEFLSSKSLQLGVLITEDRVPRLGKRLTFQA